MLLLSSMVTLSVVIPIYNEEDSIPELYRRLNLSLKKDFKSREIIFINDCSKDNSLSILKKIRLKDKTIKIISFSRNFGHMSAVNAGLDHTFGKWVVIMDADLQDPPEFIPNLFKKVKEGYEIVYAIKRNRKENKLRRILFQLFYNILNNLSSYKMPANAGTFSIVSQRVVKQLINLPEKNKYLSGLRAWVGFSQTGIEYDRGARFAGKQMSLGKLFKLATDGIISFSYIPLKLASFLGFIFATLAFFSIVAVLILRIFLNIGIVGWASTMSAILLVGGVQLITLGIIGEYLARIYDEVKGRPEYIIDEKIGFHIKKNKKTLH